MTPNDIRITIDEGSGFCFGVTRAISMAEEELQGGGSLYCLGDIVHNGEEVTRLSKLGLLTIDHSQFSHLKDTKVLLRAHGEPPQTYLTARQNHITLIDATCPVVLRLQQRIRETNQKEPQAQIVIFGKRGHAEVLGLVGQVAQSPENAAGSAIVISGEDELSLLDYHRDIRLFSQTTQPLEQFLHIVSLIKERIQPPATFKYFDTVCRQVSNRIPRLKTFASQQDAILFVCGRKSSNGKVLFEACRSVNPHSFFIEGPADIHLPTLFSQPTTENTPLSTAHSPLSNDNTALPDNNTALSNDNTALSDDNTALSDDNTALSDNNTALSDNCVALSADTSLFSSPHIPLRIGICGATSTPKWLMEQCRDKILSDLHNFPILSD